MPYLKCRNPFNFQNFQKSTIQSNRMVRYIYPENFMSVNYIVPGLEISFPNQKTACCHFNCPVANSKPFLVSKMVIYVGGPH